MSGIVGADGGLIALSDTNSLIQNGLGYSVSSGALYYPTAASAAIGVSLFNPATNKKNVVVYSLTWFSNQFLTVDLKAITADPTFPDGTITPVNDVIASTHTSGVHATYANSNVSTTGSEIMVGNANSGVLVEMLGQGRALLLPKGVSTGITLTLNVSVATLWGVNIAYIEI